MGTYSDQCIPDQRILFLCMPRLASAFGGSRKDNSSVKSICEAKACRAFEGYVGFFSRLWRPFKGLCRFVFDSKFWYVFLWIYSATLVSPNQRKWSVLRILVVPTSLLRLVKRKIRSLGLPPLSPPAPVPPPSVLGVGCGLWLLGRLVGWEGAGCLVLQLSSRFSYKLCYDW